MRLPPARSSPGPSFQGYVVLNRPIAFANYLDIMKIEEDYIFMGEPDHLLLHPFPNWATPERQVTESAYNYCAAKSRFPRLPHPPTPSDLPLLAFSLLFSICDVFARPAAFPFFYINPSDKQFVPLVEKFNDAKKPISAFDPVGNSPVIIHKDQMKVMTWRLPPPGRFCCDALPSRAPSAYSVSLSSTFSRSLRQKLARPWHDMAVRMMADTEGEDSARKKFGWVLEMWAYSVAAGQVRRCIFVFCYHFSRPSAPTPCTAVIIVPL